MDKSNTVKLFVGNLALDTTQEELSAIFEPYGQVVSCSVLRQFAFVHLQGEGAAERAIRELNGREFRGRNLVVEESRGRPLHSTKVFVGNLSGMCTTEDLQQLFQTFGKVLECDKVKGELKSLETFARLSKDLLAISKWRRSRVRERIPQLHCFVQRFREFECLQTFYCRS